MRLVINCQGFLIPKFSYNTGYHAIFFDEILLDFDQYSKETGSAKTSILGYFAQLASTHDFYTILKSKNIYSGGILQSQSLHKHIISHDYMHNIYAFILLPK